MSRWAPSRASVIGASAVFLLWAGWTALVVTGVLDGVDQRTAFAGLEHNSALAQIAAALALLTWPGLIYLALAVAGIWAWQRRLRNLAAAAWSAIVLGWGGHLLLKAIIARPRPESPLDVITHTGWAYPSGHLVAVTIGACLAIAGSIVTRQSRRMQYAVRAVAVAAVLVVGLDRWLMSAHWLSDLIGGVLWGGLVAALTLIIARVRVLPTDILLSGPMGRLTRRFGDQALTDTSTAELAAPTAGPKRRCAIVYNPVKVNDIAVFRRHVSHELSTRGWADPIWLETTVDDPGHQMARSALEQDVDLVLGAGGDGTIRVVCEELAGTGIPFGLIPAGTGNLLARNLGIPLDEHSALGVAFGDHTRKIDLVQLRVDEGEQTHTFAVMAGIGIDAVIMDRTDSDLKKAVGSAAYFVAAAKNAGHPPLPVEIQVDGAMPFKRKASLVLIGNVGVLQGGIQIIPDAHPDDGRLDLLVASPRSAADWARLTRKVLTRQRGTDDRMDHVRAKKVRITSARTDAYQMDGDTEGEAKILEAEVLPGALTLKVPA